MTAQDLDEMQLGRLYNQFCKYHVNPPSFETWKKQREKERETQK